MGKQSVDLRYMAIVPEVTPGTYVAPVDADFDIKFMIPETVGRSIAFDDDAAKYASGHHGGARSIAGQRTGNFDLSVRCGVSASFSTEPKWYKILKACGCDAVTYGATGLGVVRRKAKDEATYSVTIIDQTIGASPVYTARKYAGCIGNAVISADNTGAPLMLTASFQGVPLGDEDGAGYALQITSPDAADYETFAAASLSVFGKSLVSSSFTFDLGNTINPVLDQGKDGGVSHYYITSTAPTFATNPYASSKADWDPWAIASVNTTGAISMAMANYTLSIPNGQIMSPELASREGLTNWNITARALANGEDGTLSDSDLTAEDTFELLYGARA